MLRSWEGESDVWSAWDMSGTAVDGSPNASAGVAIILSVVGDRIEHSRFYLEAVT